MIYFQANENFSQDTVRPPDSPRHRAARAKRVAADDWRDAASQGISAAFISRLAVPLKRAHLIRAERGAGGGLRLARPPEDITILDIAETLDGPVSVLKCLTAPQVCGRHAKCPARCIWADLNATIKDSLATVTLANAMNHTTISAPRPSR